MADHFVDEDLDLLIDAVRLIPDVKIAVYATKLAHQRLRFPVKSVTRSTRRPSEPNSIAPWPRWS